MVFAICGGASAGPLQRDDRRPEPAAVGRQFLHRRAGAGGRHRGDAADLRQPARRPDGRRDRHAALYACHRLPDGVAGAGVFRQAGRQARPAGDGAAGVRAGGAVLRAVDLLSMVGADHRHGAYLVCLPLGWVSYKEHQRKDAWRGAATAASDVPRPERRRRARPTSPSVPPGSTKRAPSRHRRIEHAPRHPRSPRCRTAGHASRRHADPAACAAPGAEGLPVWGEGHLRRARFRGVGRLAPTMRWCSTTASWSRWWRSPSR